MGKPSDEMEELLQLEAELSQLEQYYKDNKICTFKDLGNQKKFTSSRAKTRLLFGSNRSGKSARGTAEEISCAMGYRPWLPEDHPDRIVRLANGQPIPVPNVGFHLLENLKVAGVNVFLPKMEEWLPKGIAKIKKNNMGQPLRVEYTNGSVLHVLSQEQSTASLEGASGHYVVSDEPPTRDKWIALTRGLIDYSGIAWIQATPIKASHFMAELMTDASDPARNVELITISIEDNRQSNGGYLPDADVDDFIASLRPDEIETRLHGRPAHLAGAVYSEWKPEAPYFVEPFDIPKDWPRIMAIDPAGRKPIAAVWIAISPDNIWYIYRDLYNPAFKKVRDVSTWIKEQEGWTQFKDGTWYQGENSEPVVMRLIDTSANTSEPTSGMSIRAAFAAHDITLQNARKMGYLASIDLVKEMISNEESEFGGGVRLVTFKGCARVAYEFLNFIWAPESNIHKATGADALDKPLKTADDTMDCIRYLAMTRAKFHNLVRILGRMRDIW